MSPTAGLDYPSSYAELRAWFDPDRKCLDHLDWLRWPEGFICPHCRSDHGWREPDLRWLRPARLGDGGHDFFTAPAH